MRNTIENKMPAPERHEHSGHDVIIELDLMRHAQKQSFEGLITAEGRRAAEELGSGRQIKAFHSPIPRAKETAEALTKDSDYVPRERKDLVGRFSPEFLEKYAAITAEHGGDESAALQIYLEGGEKKPDAGTLSSKEISRQLAEMINHFVEVSGRLKDGSHVNMALISHSGTIEHLLVDLLGEERPEFISRAGGGLKPLESVKFIISRDQSGAARLNLEFRGQRREIDPDFLKQI